MTAPRHLRLTEAAPGVALVTIDVVGAPMNVMMPALIDELADAVETIARDAGTRGAIIVSGKPNGFMAGADLKTMPTMFGQDIPPEGRGGRSKRDLVFDKNFAFNAVLRRLETCGKPFVCALGGLALGGGLELALACHACLASDRPGLVVGLPEVSVGLMPGAGGTQRALRRLGVGAALDLCLSGKPVVAEAARALGLIDAVGPQDALVDRAIALIAGGALSPVQPWDRPGFVVPGGSASAPDVARFVERVRAASLEGGGHHLRAPAAIVRAIVEGSELAMDEAVRLETRLFAALVIAPQSGNMIRTLFVERQAAERGRARPPALPLAPIARMALVGASDIAIDYACRAAAAGATVAIVDSGSAGRDAILGRVGDRAARLRLPPELAGQRFSLVPDPADADVWLIDAGAVRGLPRDVPLARSVIISNGIDAIGATASRGGHHDAVGLFRSPLVTESVVHEIIVAGAPSPETIHRAFDLVKLVRGLPIVVPDMPGSYVIRGMLAYALAAARLVDAGVAEENVIGAARDLGMAFDPPSVSRQLLQACEMADVVGRKAVNDRLAWLRELADRVGGIAHGVLYEQPADLTSVILDAQLEAATWALDNRLVADGRDGDLAAVFGWGFPRYTGGPFSLLADRQRGPA